MSVKGESTHRSVLPEVDDACAREFPDFAPLKTYSSKLRMPTFPLSWISHVPETRLDPSLSVHPESIEPSNRSHMPRRSSMRLSSGVCPCCDR